VGQALRERQLKLAVAESCSGGLISHLITNVPGSSDYFVLGAVVYSNTAKMQILGISKIVRESFGAVSSECARAMAEGIKKVGGCDLGLAVTGIAGPGGGTSSKPVGLVFFGLATPKSTTVREFRFSGSRQEIKEQTARRALEMVLEYLDNLGKV
jgi:nicotinamide-nucleotide amidase